MSFFPKPFLAYILSLISVLCFLVSPVAAQNAAKLSPEGWLMLQELTTEGIDPKASPIANKNLPPGLPKRLQAWPLTQSETGLRVGVILEWAQAPDVAALSRLDIQASEATTGLQTARVPLTSLDDLLQVPGLLRVQVNYKGKTQLDAGRRDVGGDQVFAGTGLPQPYTGAGVIVGIVDNGFDYTHPVFRHAVTGQSRIVRAWNQTLDNGNPPAGYDYGAEFTDAGQILAAGNDGPNQSHGSHVTCIAAGGGAAGVERFRGMAPESDLVLVSTDFAEQSIADGIRYIFNYAESVSRPAVINISIGGRVGPRDGSSLIDRYIEGQVKKGHIVIGAAGNEGRLPDHLYHEFAGSTDTLRTVVQWSNGQNPARTTVDCWSQANGRLEGRVAVYNNEGQRLGSLKVMNTQPGTRIDSDTLNLFEGYFGLIFSTVRANQNTNRKARILFAVGTDQPESYYCVLELWSATGHVHCWNAGENLLDTLPNGFSLPEWTAGDTLNTINEIGGTGKKTITVGAYTTTNKFTWLGGQERNIFFPTALGDFAPFSSLGPSTDGRVKPEIMAPGNSILSALSSGDPNYAGDLTAAEYREGDKRWAFGYQHGTSMAAPYVTGTVALLLQIIPTLGYDEVRTLLIESAREDEFTGSVSAGEPSWGFGKLNAFQVVRDLLDSPLARSGSTLSPMPLLAYPNPILSGSYFQLAGLDSLLPSEVYAYDAQGRLVSAFQLPVGISEVPAELSAGLYVFRVAQAGRQGQVRVWVQ